MTTKATKLLKQFQRLPSLKSIGGLAEFQGRVLRKMARDEIELDKGHKLINASAVLRDTLALAKVENDIDALKARIDTGGSANSLIRVVPFPKTN